MNPITEELMKVLPGFEGNIPWFYIDTADCMTIGIGHMVPNIFAMQPEAFAGNVSRDDINIDFMAVREAPSGKVPSFYESIAKLRLADGWAEADAGQRLDQEFLPKLPGLFPSYAKYPLPAQVAILDMAYNLGVGGLSKYPKFIGCCERRDFLGASQECHRNGIQQSRNDWTRDQFVSANS